MAYEVIRVYSFTCDGPGCKEEYECVPPSLPQLRAAHRELRLAGWDRDGKQHFCPNHVGIPRGRRGRRRLDRAEKEVMPHEPVAASRDLGPARQPVTAPPSGRMTVQWEA